MTLFPERYERFTELNTGAARGDLPFAPRRTAADAGDDLFEDVYLLPGCSSHMHSVFLLVGSVIAVCVVYTSQYGPRTLNLLYVLNASADLCSSATEN